jgi:hypothetical protein
MQPMGNEPMNAPNMKRTQRGKVNEQHQLCKETQQRFQSFIKKHHEQ